MKENIEELRANVERCEMAGLTFIATRVACARAALDYIAQLEQTSRAQRTGISEVNSASAPADSDATPADDVQWGHDLQLRLLAASQDVTESEDARQVMAEAACCLAALTGRPVEQGMERAADAAETRDAKGGE